MLKFEYCECGCKCYSASPKDADYSIYWNLGKTYTVRAGHGHYGTMLGEFSSIEKAKECAQKHYESKNGKTFKKSFTLKDITVGERFYIKQKGIAYPCRYFMTAFGPVSDSSGEALAQEYNKPDQPVFYMVI